MERAGGSAAAAQGFPHGGILEQLSCRSCVWIREWQGEIEGEDVPGQFKGLGEVVESREGDV